MSIFSSWFIQNPVVILLVAVGFLVAYLLLRSSHAAKRPKALLWPTVAWALWALWEFAITRFSPEANIRVDLLVIVPLILIITAAGVIMFFIERKSV